MTTVEKMWESLKIDPCSKTEYDVVQFESLEKQRNTSNFKKNNNVLRQKSSNVVSDFVLKDPKPDTEKRVEKPLDIEMEAQPEPV